MKKRYFFLFFVFLSSFLSSCEKVESDMHDYYPVVRTVSATVLQDGSVQVKGEIVSEGTKPVEYAGFCFSTTPVPKMLDAQVIADRQGNFFTAVYSGFDITTKYYFRSWATNGNGYSYGNIISLDSIKATPIIAPCSPAMNTVTIGAGTETWTTVDPPAFSSASGWDFQATSNSIVMYFTFGSKPVTRIYTTTSFNSPASDQVHVIFYSGFISGGLSDGSDVYVNQTGVDTWEMTICSASWSNGGGTNYMTAKFRCPL
jgi:hypothetical protein